MTTTVIVNEQQCQRIGECLRLLQFRPGHFKRPFLTFPADPETKLRAYLFSSAICHQTHTLVSKTKNCKGWSCLEDVFTMLGKTRSPLLDPAFLVTQSPEGLGAQLQPLFADDGDPAHCTLDRSEERARFIIDIAKALNDRYNGKVEQLLAASAGYLMNNGRGLYELLNAFEAFSDPMRKKSTVFLQLIVNAGLFTIRDPQSVEPVMDYHMQRLLLRTGCIEVIDEQFRRSLQERTLLPSDDAVRGAAVAAVRCIAAVAQKDYFTMDEMLWSLGRSCCKEKTLCLDGVCNRTPCTFFEFVDIPSHGHCIFFGVCKGSTDAAYRSLWQPMVETHYY